MKHLKKFNEKLNNQVFNQVISGLSEEQKKEICIFYGVCPECGSILENVRGDYNSGQTTVRCPEDWHHFSNYVFYDDDEENRSQKQLRIDSKIIDNLPKVEE